MTEWLNRGQQTLYESEIKKWDHDNMNYYLLYWTTESELTNGTIIYLNNSKTIKLNIRANTHKALSKHFITQLHTRDFVLCCI